MDMSIVHVVIEAVMDCMAVMTSMTIETGVAIMSSMTIDYMTIRNMSIRDMCVAQDGLLRHLEVSSQIVLTTPRIDHIITHPRKLSLSFQSTCKEKEVVIIMIAYTG
ncbi:hypothetical protein HHI36_014188, partial [Cryptolaemus montrouzieri]